MAALSAKNLMLRGYKLVEERKECYRKARQFTASIVFFYGNEMIDEDELAEVWHRNYWKR